MKKAVLISMIAATWLLAEEAVQEQLQTKQTAQARESQQKQVQKKTQARTQERKEEGEGETIRTQERTRTEEQQQMRQMQQMRMQQQMQQNRQMQNQQQINRPVKISPSKNKDESMGVFSKVGPALLVLTALQTQLLAYSDKDMDGVDDSRDRCPDSSMEDLVDATGCVPKTGITLALGGSRSSGDYGTSGTITSETRDIQLSFVSGGWYASAATSYLESGVDDPAIATQESSGMGDTYLGVGYTVLGSAWSFGVQGVIKVPTADEDIGTGNSDVGGYATLARLSDGMTLFTTVGYLITGDDTDIEYNDIPSLTIGAGKSIGEHLFASLSAAHADALVDGMDPSRTLSLFLAYRLNGCWFVNASYTKGFSDSVADNTFVLMGGYNF